MKKIILGLLLCSTIAHAQKLQYGGMQQIGIMANANGLKGKISMVNGVRFMRFFAGLGADFQGQNNNLYRIDYYGYSRPSNTAVFLDLRYYINKQKNFFVRGDGGMTFIVSHAEQNDYYKMEKGRGGYGALGLGFKARMGKEIFYSFDVSYNIRQIRYSDESLNWGGGWTKNRYDLRQSAILINLGIEIF